MKNIFILCVKNTWGTMLMFCLLIFSCSLVSSGLNLMSFIYSFIFTIIIFLVVFAYVYITTGKYEKSGIPYGGKGEVFYGTPKGCIKDKSNEMSGRYKVNFISQHFAFDNDMLPATVTPYKGRLSVVWDNGWTATTDCKYLNFMELKED